MRTFWIAVSRVKGGTSFGVDIVVLLCGKRIVSHFTIMPGDYVTSWDVF